MTYGRRPLFQWMTFDEMFDAFNGPDSERKEFAKQNLMQLSDDEWNDWAAYRSLREGKHLPCD